MTRFIFIGRLVDWKAVDIIIEAAKRIAGTVKFSLEIVGDGGMRRTWEELADRLNLQENVHFSGWMSQQECVGRLREFDVLVLPSLFECGGAVVLEAMAMALPVVATGWGGPSDYLDESCGVLIPPTSRESLIDGFAEAMTTLSQSPELRTRLGQAGYEKARRKFDWNAKIEDIQQFIHAPSSCARLGPRTDQGHEICQMNHRDLSQRRLFMVLSPRSLPYAHLAIESLYRNCADEFSLCLITDSQDDVSQLERSLQGLKERTSSANQAATVRGEADLKDLEGERFGSFEHIRNFRRGHPCWRKITDPILLSDGHDEMIILDPDLYFPNRFRFEPNSRQRYLADVAKALMSATARGRRDCDQRKRSARASYGYWRRAMAHAGRSGVAGLADRKTRVVAIAS